MPSVLTCLTISTLLAFIHIMAQVAMPRIETPEIPYDPNREQKRELGPKAARAERALRNFLETYPLFIALAAVLAISGNAAWAGAWGAVIYLAGRAIYLPLYIAGIAPIRSAVWTLSFIGLGMMFYAALAG